jgi:hypothetical protein
MTNQVGAKTVVRIHIPRIVRIQVRSTVVPTVDTPLQSNPYELIY